MEKFEVVKYYQDFLKRINDIEQVIKPTEIKEELKDIEEKMSSSSFWDNQDLAKKVTTKSKSLKDKLLKFNKVKEDIEELNILIELDDLDLYSNADLQVENLKKELEEYEIELLLNGKYDKNNAIVEIHPGAGGTEAQDWALMLYRMYKRYTERTGYEFELIDYDEGTDAGLKSVTFMVVGENAYGYLKAEKGVHRLIRISPFDSNARRHTSFAGVNVYPEITEDTTDFVINPNDLRIDTYRASGAGGQYVNTTDSAVRITHIPTGIVVSCQNERSQIQNREKALNVLKAKLYSVREQERLDEIENVSGKVTDNAFGSQIRTYTLHPYSLVKDHRTGVENGNPSSVLDGDLDMFINAYLQKLKAEE